MKRLLGAAAALVFALGLAGPMPAAPAFAVDAAAADGKRKINLAGRQRMLTQRMAKAACFAAIGLDRAGHVTMMREAHDLFDRTLEGLRRGDREQGLLVETNDDVLEGLGRVRVLWSRYGTAVRQALDAQAVPPETLSEIARLNIPTLVEMNKTVKLTERAYGDSSVPLHLAIALNISGRQRMLTQKMSKELCLISAGHEAEANRAALAGTVDLFDASLEALIEGAPFVGIQPPRGAELAAQLDKVSGMWAELKPIFDRIVAGADPDPEALARVAIENNPLLVEMNKAVFLYEGE